MRGTCTWVYLTPELELQISQYTVPIARRILLVNGHRGIILNQNIKLKNQTRGRLHYQIIQYYATFDLNNYMLILRLD